MKFFRYMACLFGASLVFAFLGGIGNIGAIPAVLIYGFFMWLARVWSRSVDEKSAKTTTVKNNKQAALSIVNDELQRGVNPSVSRSADSNLPDSKGEGVALEVSASSSIVQNSSQPNSPVSNTDRKEDSELSCNEVKETDIENHAGSDSTALEYDNPDVVLNVCEVNQVCENSATSLSTLLTPKYCRKCGFELKEGSNFCSRCGTAIIVLNEMDNQ